MDLGFKTDKRIIEGRVLWVKKIMGYFVNKKMFKMLNFPKEKMKKTHFVLCKKIFFKYFTLQEKLKKKKKVQ